VCLFVIPCLFESLSVDCIVTGSIKERFWSDLGIIWKSVGRRLGAIRDGFGKVRTMLRAMWICIEFGDHSGRHLGNLLETILHLGGHVWRFRH